MIDRANLNELPGLDDAGVDQRTPAET